VLGPWRIIGLFAIPDRAAVLFMGVVSTIIRSLRSLSRWVISRRQRDGHSTSSRSSQGGRFLLFGESFSAMQMVADDGDRRLTSCNSPTIGTPLPQGSESTETTQLAAVEKRLTVRNLLHRPAHFL